MVRVVHVMPSVVGAGGAERSLAAMAPHLHGEVDLHVVTFTGRDGLRDELEGAGARLTDVGPASMPAALRAIRRIVRDERPDLVHTTLLDADVLGRLAAATSATPVVSSLVNVSHGRETFQERPGASWKKAVVWAADATTARTVVRFHALTEHVATTMSRKLLVPRSRIDVIPRGRDPERLGTRTAERRSNARHALGVGESDVVIAAAARHEVQKGLDVLLRAVSASRCAREAVVLVGGRDGAQTAELRRLVDELELADRVRFLGQRDDVAELMCAADVWCVPSRWEGLGSILIEAMALAVPVVTTDIPPIREVAGEPPVFELVAPDDPAAMAAGLDRVLGDPDAAATRARLGHQRFLEHFTVQEVARRTIDFYRESLESTRWRRVR